MTDEQTPDPQLYRQLAQPLVYAVGQVVVAAAELEQWTLSLGYQLGIKEWQKLDITAAVRKIEGRVQANQPAIPAHLRPRILAWVQDAVEASELRNHVVHHSSYAIRTELEWAWMITRIRDPESVIEMTEVDLAERVRKIGGAADEVSSIVMELLQVPGLAAPWEPGGPQEVPIELIRARYGPSSNT